MYLEKYKKYKPHFRMQRRVALNRGIRFEFTFEEWIKVWVDSGHLEERGRRKGQYQMARFSDKGPYAKGNIKIITIEENRAEQKMTYKHCARIGIENGNSKLTDSAVLEIRGTHVPWSRDFSPYALAKKFRVSRQVIISVINRETWTHI